MFMVFATGLVVFFYCCATADILTFYRNASCFSLLWLYLGNSQVSVYRTIDRFCEVEFVYIDVAICYLVCGVETIFHLC